MRRPWLAVSTIAAVGLLAPLLANDVPLAASVAGELRWPAFTELFGHSATPPEGTTWKRWWIDLDADSEDWAIMPPWPTGPFELHAGALAEGPSLVHPLGLDESGRDQFARLLWGARTAILVAVGSVLIATLIGVPLGVLAGLLGGVCDALVLRLIETFLCFPALVAVLALTTIVEGSITTVVVVLGSVYWTAIARVVRGELLSLRERPFVAAAEGFGIGRRRLLTGHLLPGLVGPFAVMTAFLASGAILVEATLTFLGIGIGLESVSWGAMLQQGKDQAHTGAWHLWLFPALALGGTVLGLHACADWRPRAKSGSAPGASPR